ncbi:hypothetical protein ACXIUT_07850 [Achromobacter denitrificans]
MRDSAAHSGELSIDDAVRLARDWAAAHHADAGRSRNFALQWHQDALAADRRGDVLLRDLEFFFLAASKDAAYWRSVGDFSEEATGIWGVQALKALAGLNAVGLLAAGALFAARGGSAYTAGAAGSSALFLAGVLLAYPSLRLVRIARVRASATAASHSEEAGSASTWEQLQAANDANPNVGRKERKLALRLGAIMALMAIAGCSLLVTAVWL